MSFRKKIEPFLLGGISSCNAEFYTFPIDLVKTRLQIQGQAINQNSTLRYKGMFDCFLKIRKEEGLKNFFSGYDTFMLSFIFNSEYIIFKVSNPHWQDKQFMAL